MKTGRAGRRKKSAGRSRSPQALGDALEQLAQDLDIAKPLNRYAVLTSWGEIVGEQIAKVATAERVEDGVLIVRVTTAPWRAELSLRRAEILEKVAARVGKGVVREIRFR